MAPKTLEQRETDLQTQAGRLIDSFRHSMALNIGYLMREPLDVPGIGMLFLEPLFLDNQTGYTVDATIQSLHALEDRLSETFNNNHAINFNIKKDNSSLLTNTYDGKVTIRTREDLRKVLVAWSTKRANLESQYIQYHDDRQETLDQISGTTPVTNSEGRTLTGLESIVERERLLSVIQTQSRIRRNFLNTSIPTGLSTNLLEACQQATEWLITVSEKKSNWVVNAIEESYIPSKIATIEQEAALRIIETERQKGIQAINRATTVAAVRAAYNAAKSVIENTIVSNAPIWKLDTGSDIPLTDGRYVLPYTESSTSLTLRADNSVIDAEDAPDAGNVSIDKVKSHEDFTFTYQPASGSIASSFGITITHGGTKHPPVGNYDIDLTARNTSGPSLLKLRYTIPDLQPSFPKAALPYEHLTVPGDGSNLSKTINFDEPTGGNGKLTYNISADSQHRYRTDPNNRRFYISTSVPRPRQTFTFTATDEDGDIATQTFTILIT